MWNLDDFSRLIRRVVDRDPSLDELPLETLLDNIPRVDQISGLPPGTTVLVRADIDVPMKDGTVEDPSRIEADLATLEYCVAKGWKTIVFGHVGRDPGNTARPICQTMAAHAGHSIRLIEDWMDEERACLREDLVQTVAEADPGSVFMLENTRKYRVEQALWDADAPALPGIIERMYSICTDIRLRLTSVEVNEAIAASNPDFSSAIVPLAMSVTSLGFHIATEMQTHIRNARKSNLVVFSGLKIDKLDDLEGILARDGLTVIIAAGSLAMALRKARAQLAGAEFFIGSAETDPSNIAYIPPERISQAKRIVNTCEERGIDLVLPRDFVLDTGEVSTTIPEGHCQMDVGPETRELFADKVRAYVRASRTARQPYTMFYNGVFGKFEDPRFEEGTKSFIHHLKEMTNEGISTYVGGGEGRMALLRYGSLDDVTHAFTCGGTVLKSLTNRHIPFLKAMYLQNTCEDGQEKLWNQQT